jgi:hypothetical protein
MEKDQFGAHPLWTQVSACLDILSETEADTPAEYVEEQERIRWLGSQVSKYVASDPSYFSIPMLDAVQTHWRQVHATLGQVEAGSFASLTPARELAEQCLPLILGWPPASARQGGSGKTETKFFSAYESATKDASAALRARIDTLMTEATARDEQHAAAVAELEQQIAALAATMTEQTNRITTATTTLDEKVASIETDAAEAQNARNEKFAEWVENRETEWVETKAQPILDQIDATRETAAERLLDLEALSAQVEKVAGKTGSAVLARDYGRYSTREWVTGLLSYGLGIGLLVAVGIYLLLTVGDVERDADISWQYIALKLGLTITVIAASTVLFQVGRQSLRGASENKKIELELRAIVPFLADLNDPEASKQAKIAFVERSFGRTAGESIDASDAVSATTIESLVKLITQADK